MSHKNWRKKIITDSRIRKRGYKGIRSSWKTWKKIRNRRFRAREHNILVKCVKDTSIDIFPTYKKGVAWDAS